MSLLCHQCLSCVPIVSAVFELCPYSLLCHQCLSCVPIVSPVSDCATGGSCIWVTSQCDQCPLLVDLRGKPRQAKCKLSHPLSPLRQCLLCIGHLYVSLFNLQLSALQLSSSPALNIPALFQILLWIWIF